MRQKLIHTIGITLLLLGFGVNAQKTQIKHLGNTFNVKVESSKNDMFNVYITNKTNDNSAKNIQINYGITGYQFQKKLEAIFNSLINQYVFSDSIGSFTIKNTENILKLDLITLFETFTPNKAVFKGRFKKEFKYTSFMDYAKGLEKSSSKKDTIIININNENYELNDSLVKEEDEFIAALQSIAIEETEKNILSHYYKIEEIRKILSVTTLNVVNNKKITNLYESSLGNDPYNFVGNFIAEDQSVYAIGINQSTESNFFTLRFCGIDDDDCKYSNKIAFDDGVSKFEKMIALKLTGTKKLTREESLKLYIICNKLNTKTYQERINAPFKKELDSLIYAIENEKTKYSGVLKLNKRVNIYKKIKIDEKYCIGRKKRKDVKLDSIFIPEYAAVRFFNNKANNIVVVGKLVDEKEETVSEHVSVNFEYSIPVRSFNSTLNSVSLNDEKGNIIGYINYNDVFNYYPFEEKFNYSVKNNEYKIIAGDTTKIEQRKLADFFTPIIFSDILGLNSGSENGLIIAEGRARIPLWLFNCRKKSLFTALRTDINVTIFNGFDENSRSINIESTTQIDTTTLNINPFDYVKHANINGGISLDVLNIELKGLATNMSFGAGMRYYRAALKYTQTNTTEKDIIFYDQLNMIAPEVNVNFQIRPQTNFGADLNLSYSWIRAAGTRESTSLNVPNTLSDKKMFRLNLDLYSKVNPKTSNGGIYGRLGGFYYNETKDFFPQIMVGYATNLSSFINKFKKK